MEFYVPKDEVQQLSDALAAEKVGFSVSRLEVSEGSNIKVMRKRR